MLLPVSNLISSYTVVRSTPVDRSRGVQLLPAAVTLSQAVNSALPKRQRFGYSNTYNVNVKRAHGRGLWRWAVLVSRDAGCLDKHVLRKRRITSGRYSTAAPHGAAMAFAE